MNKNFGLILNSSVNAEIDGDVDNKLFLTNWRLCLFIYCAGFWNQGRNSPQEFILYFDPLYFQYGVLHFYRWRLSALLDSGQLQSSQLCEKCSTMHSSSSLLPWPWVHWPEMRCYILYHMWVSQWSTMNKLKKLHWRLMAIVHWFNFAKKLGIEHIVQVTSKTIVKPLKVFNQLIWDNLMA